MMEKRWIQHLLAACAILLFTLFAACGKKTPTLNLLVWEGYADASYVHAFEEANHCKVSASYMGSSDELVAKLRGGSAGTYDVISPSSDVATMIASCRTGRPARCFQNAQLWPAFSQVDFSAFGSGERSGLMAFPSCGDPIL